MTEHIIIGDISPRIQYVGDGVQTVFTYPFPIFADADMTVFLDDAETPSGFTVNGAGNSSGGDVTFDTAPAVGVRVTLLRNLSIARTSDFQEGGAFRAQTINDELDRIVAYVQQIADDAGRAVILAPTDPTASLTLPSKDVRSGKYLTFDSNGDPETATGISAWIIDNGVPSDAADGDNGDLYLDTGTGNIYGPKSGGAWGVAVGTLIGPTGAPGADGADGADGVFVGTEDTVAPQLADKFALLDTSDGDNPKYSTLQTILDAGNDLAEDTDPDTDADFLYGYDASANAAKKVKMGLVAPQPAIASLLHAAGSDGSSHATIDGVVLDDGRMYIPVTATFFTNQWHMGGNAKWHNTTTKLDSRTRTWQAIPFPQHFYGKPTKVKIGGGRHMFCLTETGWLLFAGYTDASITDDPESVGAHKPNWIVVAGPGSAPHHGGYTVAIQKTVEDFCVSQNREHGGRYDVGNNDHLVFRCSDGTAYSSGYSAYGSGQGTTSNHVPTQIETAAATPITGVTDMVCGGGQYHRTYLLNTSGIHAYGYNTSYGALGDGTTTNRSYATLTSFPNPSGKSGIAKWLPHGDHSEGAMFVLYGDGDLYGCGVQGGNKWLDNSGAHVNTPVLIATSVDDFWPLGTSSSATYAQLVYRKTDNSMFIRGYSNNSNFYGCTTGTSTNTAYVETAFDQSFMAGRHWAWATPMGYSAAATGYLAQLDNGEVWVMANSSIDMLDVGAYPANSNFYNSANPEIGNVAGAARIALPFLASTETIVGGYMKRHSSGYGVVRTSANRIFMHAESDADIPVAAEYNNTGPRGRWYDVTPAVLGGQA